MDNIKSDGILGFIEKNQKMITYSLGGIIGVFVLLFAYNQYILEPQELEAKDKIFMAQRYYDMDSFAFALNGDGKAPGFIQVADDYGSTNAGKLAKFYAGTIYMKQGKYDEAIDMFKGYEVKSNLMQPLAYGLLGDAYAQKKEYATAIDYYNKAATYDDNKLTTPKFLLKSGLANEELKQYSEAIQIYQQIKDKYPNSEEATKADTYLGRAKAVAEQGN